MNGRSGYALPTVLAIIALLSLVFVSAASALGALAAATRGAVEGAEFQRLAMSAEAEALFTTATTPFAADGLQVGAPPPQPGAQPQRSRLRLDGRAYAWGDDPARGLRVALQDEAGLINLDSSRPDALLRLFARLGLTAIESETMRDRLLDAIDTDQDRRPRGAEAADYLARGRTPPPPGGFANLAEVNGVLDWEGVIAGQRRSRLAAWATADAGSQGFNVNTAPPDVLAVVLALTPAGADRIGALREASPITALTQIGLDGDAAAAARALKPNGRVRFSFTDIGRGMTYSSRLAPRDDPAGPPWAAAASLIGHISPAADSHAPHLPQPPG